MKRFKRLNFFFGSHEENKIGKDFIVIFVCCTAATGVGVSFGVGGPSQMGQHNMNDVGRKPELSKS